jgi:cardiolipin synthase
VKRGVACLFIIVSGFVAATWMAECPSSQAEGPRIAPAKVVINEVGWSGTNCSPYDEWIELYNNTDAAIDLTGWTLAAADGTPMIVLNGILPAAGYFLLERTDDDTVRGIAADQIYGNNGSTWALKDTGEGLELRDETGSAVDSANSDGGAWPGGANNPDFSMERIESASPDVDSNWAANDGITRNGLDCTDDALNGTPKAHNSATPLPGADLGVDKDGPQAVAPGALITYTICVQNLGQAPAQAAWLTDVLPAEVEFVTHSARYPFSRPLSGTLVWDLGEVPTDTASDPITFTLTGQVSTEATGKLTNRITVTSATNDGHAADSHDQVTSLVGGSPVVIEAVYYDAYEPEDADEGFRLMNVSVLTVPIGGWTVTDLEGATQFPPSTTLAPGQAIWCARQATAFARQFGFPPDFEFGADTDPAVPNMSGGIPRFADDGDECIVTDEYNAVADALVYEGGNTSIDGWRGPAVEPWTAGSSFAAEGQILYRKRDEATGLPVPDSDSAADWAQDPGDQVGGRKVRYPGWDLSAFFFTQRVTETANLQVGVAPDNLYDAVAGLLSGAQERIEIESYSFRSRELAGVLLDRLAQGVSVTLLLEGAPAFEGVSDEERWIARQLYDAGAQVLFMAGNGEDNVHDRYDNQHAKIVLIDDRTALIGSENLNNTSFATDDKSNGTAGRRGVYLITDAPGVVARLAAIFEADADPIHHADVMGCEQVPDLCTPSSGFEPAPTPDWISYTVQFPALLSTSGTMAFEVIQSPENSLRARDSLLGLLGRAAAGDVLYVEQFCEFTHWGPAEGTPETDPSLRLQAYVDAARRGATVRVLLDNHFDEAGDNAAAVRYLQTIARAEALDLEARLGDPTFLGLHNKMVLGRIGGKGYVHVGSLNGSEASSKVNREVALQVQSDAAYDYLAAVFDNDWRVSTPPAYLPLVLHDHAVPQHAGHLLISEVYYVSVPPKEWVEIYNPGSYAVDLASYKIGDAALREDAEGMYQFPPATILGPNQVLVVAATAAGFHEDYPGRAPDFEIADSDPGVPNMLNYAPWGTWDWGLGNAGDEVLLLDGNDLAVDVVVYGDGSYPGVVAHPGGVAYGHSLERVPAWLDTDNCLSDLRDWPYPSPGELP